MENCELYENLWKSLSDIAQLSLNLLEDFKTGVAYKKLDYKNARKF